MEVYDSQQNKVNFYNNLKNIRSCNRKDFELVNMGEDFDAITVYANHLICVDNFENMTLTN